MLHSTSSVSPVDNSLIPKFPFNLIIQKSLSNEQILNVFSRAFDVEVKDIQVENYHMEVLVPSDSPKIICQCYEIDGEFQTLIVIWSDSETVKGNILKLGSIIDVGRKVSRASYCKCLVRSNLPEDNADDLYYLVRENGKPTVVWLDQDAVEDHVYKISREDSK